MHTQQISFILREDLKCLQSIFKAPHYQQGYVLIKSLLQFFPSSDINNFIWFFLKVSNVSNHKINCFLLHDLLFVVVAAVVVLLCSALPTNVNFKIKITKKQQQQQKL